MRREQLCLRTTVKTKERYKKIAIIVKLGSIQKYHSTSVDLKRIVKP